MLPRGGAALLTVALLCALGAEPVAALWGARIHIPYQRARCHGTHRHRCPPKHRVKHNHGAAAPKTGTSDFGPTSGGGALAPVGPVATGGTESPSAPAGGSEETPALPGPAHLQVTAEDSAAFRFVLSRPSVPAGKVIIEFVNRGQDEHNLTAFEPSEGTLAGSFPNTAPGAHPAMTVEMRRGSYTLFCSLPSHEEKGMKATLLVN